MSDTNVGFEGFTKEDVIVSKKRLKCYQQLRSTVIRYYSGDVFELTDNWEKMAMKYEATTSQLLHKSDELSLANSTIVQLTKTKAALIDELNVAVQLLNSSKNELDEYQKEAKINFNISKSRCDNLELKYHNLLHSKKVADMEIESLRRKLSMQEALQKSLLEEQTVRYNTLKRKMDVVEEQAAAKKRFCSMM